MKSPQNTLFRTISRYFPAGENFKNLRQLTTGNIVALTVTLLGYPILSRLYDDVKFGELALFQSSAIILTQLSTLNYEEALVLIRQKTKFGNLAFSTLYLNVAFSGVTLILIATCWFLDFIPSTYFPYVFLLPVGVALRGLMQIGNYSFVSQKLFKKVSTIKVLDRASFQMLAISFGILRFSGNFLIIGYLISNLISGAYSLFNFKKYLDTSQNWRARLIAMKEYKDFPKFALPSIFLDQLSRQLPVYFITYIVTTEITGQFSLAYRVLSIPEMIIGASVGQLFYQKLSELFGEKKPIKPIIRRLWLSLFFLSIIPFGVILFWGEGIFAFVFGKEWRVSGRIASYLTPMLFVMFISTPTSFIFTVLRNQKRSLAINIIVLLVRTAALYFGLTYLPFLSAMLLFAFSEIALILVYNLIAWQLLNQAER